MEEFPGAFTYNQLAVAKSGFIDWWFEAAGDKIMNKKKEFFQNLAIQHDRESYENAIRDFNLIYRFAAGPDRIEVYCHNFTRRYKWFVE